MSEKDFIQTLGYIGFATRLKRISDTMMHDGRKLYKELGLDIEPNWYIIFQILKNDKKLSVTEIADKVQLAHPSIIAITDKMVKKGYLKSKKGTDDSRKRVLELTAKGKIRLPEFEKMWDAGKAGLEKAFKDIKALEMIGEIEQRMANSGFKDRTLDELKRRINRHYSE